MESASAWDSKEHGVNPPSHLSPRTACLGPVCAEGFYDREPDRMKLIRVSLKKKNKRLIPSSKGLWASTEGVHKSYLFLVWYFTVLFTLLSISWVKRAELSVRIVKPLSPSLCPWLSGDADKQ